MSRQHIWDLPTRLFHWLLVIAIITAYVTGQLGGNLIVWHGRAGLFILGLIVFRIVWGLIGSPCARFSHFVRGPRAILAYLQGHWQGVGHNPLGALSVIALLLLVGAQATTGLFTNDDITFEGPLAGLVSKETSDSLLGVHVQLQNILIGLVVLHLLAIVFYALVKRDNLVRPMVTGWRPLAPDAAPVSHPPFSAGRSATAFVIALSVAVLTVLAASGELANLTGTPAVAAPTTPAW